MALLILLVISIILLVDILTIYFSEDLEATSHHFTIYKILFARSLMLGLLNFSSQMLIGGSVSFVAGKKAIRTVYWRTGSNGRLLKTAKTCMFQGPPKPAPSSTSATAYPLSPRMDNIPKTILNVKN